MVYLNGSEDTSPQNIEKCSEKLDIIIIMFYRVLGKLLLLDEFLNTTCNEK